MAATAAIAAIICPQWSSACQPETPSVPTQRRTPSEKELSGPWMSPIPISSSVLPGRAPPYHGRLRE
jgi:hypothetical protein